MCWANDRQTIVLNASQVFKAIAAIHSQRQERTFVSVSWCFLVLNRVSFIPGLLLLSQKETDLMAKDINSTCVARKWVFYHLGASQHQRNSPFVTGPSSQLSITETSSRFRLIPAETCEIEHLGTHVYGLRRWIHYSSESNLMCADRGGFLERRADILPRSQACKWSTCCCWSMLTFIKINKNSTLCLSRHHTHSHTKYYLLCAQRVKSNLCFSAPLKCLLGQSCKSPIESNYVGHAGVKLHFIKNCKIWKMQIPHQEEVCLMVNPYS